MAQFSGTHPWINTQIIQASENKDVGHLLGISVGDELGPKKAIEVLQEFLGKFSEYMGVSKNRGTPKSSILIGISIINHPFWGTPIFGNTHIDIMGIT